MSTKLLQAVTAALVWPLLCLQYCTAGRELYSQRCISSCGDVANVSYPFRLKGDPPRCGNPRFELTCENNQTRLSRRDWKFNVLGIFYENRTIRVVDTGLESDSCSIPLHSTNLPDFSCEEFPYYSTGSPSNLGYCRGDWGTSVLNCEKPMNSSGYVDASPCVAVTSSSTRSFWYAFRGCLSMDGFPESCSIEAIFSAKHFDHKPYSLSEIYNELLIGLDLRWFIGCTQHFQVPFIYRFLEFWLSYWWFCRNFNLTYTRTGSISSAFRTITTDLTYLQIIFAVMIGYMLLRFLLGVLCLIPVVVYKYRKRHLSADNEIEEFLQRHNNLIPIRYSYSDVKKITQGFKSKIGQGGYGSVFKGKLRSGHLVAVKLLEKSKAKGQDFVNEVATIGRIHHANVVCLIGFCVEGSKQALVYEFMPNGSLDKIIFSKEKTSLKWEKLYEIALGVAKGLEYLHRGCDMQILHFDIKPHNILLDHNLNPKLSDFGLAKLYPTNDSIVSLTAVRGTMGYIAPEMFYKNIGGVSHKADVYSFGMLLLEMVSKRKNLKCSVEQPSQVYFPSWIYDRFHEEESINLEECTETEEKVVRKMVIVAFWCIQLKPNERPPINKVIEMLEGEVELLQIPPKPFVRPHN